MDEVNLDYVKDLIVNKKKTHSEVSLILQEAYPEKKGFSVRSVRRFCYENDIHSQQHVSNDDLEQCARTVVAKVRITGCKSKCNINPTLHLLRWHVGVASQYRNGSIKQYSWILVCTFVVNTQFQHLP